MNNNILNFTNSLSFGGGEKIASTLANELVCKYDFVGFLTIENNKKYNLDNHVVQFKNPFFCSFGILGKLITNVMALVYLIYIIKSKKIDVVISHLFRSNYINVIACRLTGCKSIIVTHGSILKYSDNSLLSKLNIFFIKMLFKRSTKKVFLTNRMMNDYIPFVGEQNNIVIPNCYNLSDIVFLSKESIDNYYFENEQYYVFIGRFHRVKNINFIIDGINKSNKNLMLIGDGDLFYELKLKYESNRIIFLGYKDNPYPYLKKARAVILASDSEGFPNVLIEALSLGVPIISSDCRTGPREILNITKNFDDKHMLTNEYGALFPCNDIVGFKYSIDYIERNNFSIEKLKLRALDFDVSNITKRYKDIVEIT